MRQGTDETTSRKPVRERAGKGHGTGIVECSRGKCKRLKEGIERLPLGEQTLLRPPVIRRRYHAPARGKVPARNAEKGATGVSEFVQPAPRLLRSSRGAFRIPGINRADQKPGIEENAGLLCCSAA
jgi:hypothetical protein